MRCSHLATEEQQNQLTVQGDRAVESAVVEADSAVLEADLANLAVEDVLRLYKSDLRAGLEETIASQKLIEVGRNEISFKKESSWVVLLFRQFQSSVVILLLIAALVSFFTSDHLQAAGILAAVIINAAVGFLTELQSQNR